MRATRRVCPRAADMVPWIDVPFTFLLSRNLICLGRYDVKDVNNNICAVGASALYV